MLTSRRLLGFALVLPLALGALPRSAEAQVTGRYAHTTTILPNGNILLTGGIDSAGNPIDTFELHSATSSSMNSFQPLGVDFVDRASHTATLMADGRVLIVGGNNAAGALITTNEVQIYDPNTDTLSNGPNLVRERENHTATLLPNGQVLVTGGTYNDGGGLPWPQTSSCEIFDPDPNDDKDPADQAWLTNCGGQARGTEGSMGLARGAHTATLLADGRILVTGGVISDGNDQAVSTEFFEYQLGASGLWTPGPALIAKRAYHTATQMGDGRVLIAGGWNPKNEEENLGYLETTEIYDPVTNGIAPGQNMFSRKAFHSSVLQGDGRVQIFGGLGNITTSYHVWNMLFESNSILALTNAGLPLATASIIPAQSVVNFQFFDIPVSRDVSGRIIEGEIRFSSPVVIGEGVTVLYENLGTSASINGQDINQGTLGETSFSATMNNPAGLVLFDPFNTTADAATLAAGSVVNFNPSGITQDDPPSDILGTSNLTFDLGITVPDWVPAGATVLDAKARLISGSFTRESNETQQGYSVTLNSGTAESFQGSCGAVVVDEVLGHLLSCTGVAFDDGVDGEISATTTTAVNSPAPGAVGLEMSGVNVLVTMSFNRVELTGLTFTFDGSTIVVKEMAFSSPELYTPNDDTWAYGTEHYEPANSIFQHSGAIHPNGDVLLYGGRNCVNVTDCNNRAYTPATGPKGYVNQFGGGTGAAWTEATNMQSARRSHTATLLVDGDVLVAGGSDGPDSIAATETYDPVADEWESAGNLNVGRSQHTAALLPNSTVLVAGGFRTDRSTGATNHAEIYYPETRRWLPTEAMITSRTLHTSVLLPDGNVMVMGGFRENEYLNSCEIYYSTSRIWVQLPNNMSARRAQHTASLMHDGRILVAGGVNVGGVLQSAEIFDPTDLSWSAAQSLIKARHSHTATLLSSGTVLVAGGNDGLGEIADAEIYDPRFDRWTTTDPNDVGDRYDLQKARLGHTAQLLPNGKVFLTGGYDKYGGAIDMGEDYNSVFGVWTEQGLFDTARGDHASVLLKDGTMLVTGGYTGVNALASVEKLYFTFPPDASTPNPTPRQPEIVRVSTGLFTRGTRFTVGGAHFKGETEAAGGGSASQNSDGPRPGLTLQRLDATGNNAASSGGFMINLTSAVYYQKESLAIWDTADSSVTVILPSTMGLLPNGYYHARVVANDQYSESFFVQAGPPRPAGSPTTPVGAIQGPSSVTWTWAIGSLGVPYTDFDGFNIYSSTSGLWLSTVAPTATQWVQEQLGPDATAQIKIAAYSISGDGNVIKATIPVTMQTGEISGNITGTAESTGSIRWNWARVDGADYYEVWSASSTTLLASPAPTGGSTEEWGQSGLSTNTAYGIMVRAHLIAGFGSLSSQTTVYTLAAQPVANSPPYKTNISTDYITADWRDDIGNPSSTTYVAYLVYEITGTSITVSGILDTEYTWTDLVPNGRYSTLVAAVNGDGILTNFTNLGSTYTQTNPPLSALVTGIGLDNFDLQWDNNFNSTWTIYQVVMSTDPTFSTAVSTPINWGDAFTSTQTHITGLFTGFEYYIEVYAQGGFGHIPVHASTVSTTDNGGGEPGHLGIVVNPDAITQIDGTLGNLRRVSMRILPNTFPAGTVVFISSAVPADVGSGLCGTLPGVRIYTRPPGLQPAHPMEFGLSYAAPPAVGTPATLALTRYDDVRNTCVPLRSTVDTVTEMTYTQINHLSYFQLVNIAAQGTIDHARAFPNPLRVHQHHYMTFDRLPSSTRVHVYTLHGEKVFDARTNTSGIVTWDARNMHGRPVASGLYIAVFERDNSKHIMKVVIIR